MRQEIFVHQPHLSILASPSLQRMATKAMHRNDAVVLVSLKLALSLLEDPSPLDN